MSENNIPSPPLGEQTAGLNSDMQLDGSEQGEIAKEAAELTLRIDKAALDSIAVTTPPAEEAPGYHRTLEEAQSAIDAKKSELEGVIDRIKRLPEELRFQPGITLIVGENGGGKSSLARALFLVGKYHRRVESSREFYASREIPEYEQKTDEQIVEGAYNDVFQPKSGNDAEELAMAGVGAYIAPAMIEGTSFVTEGTVTYVDAGEAYGRAQTQTKADLQDSRMSVPKYGSGMVTTETIEIKGKGSFGVKSTRQTVDAYLADYKQTRKSSHTGAIEFIDEPETGMSPRRHQHLEDEIYDVFGSAGDGNIVIVPTNSVVLFQSDLPRIDLDYPERGIHRPSEFPDHDDVVV